MRFEGTIESFELKNGFTGVRDSAIDYGVVFQPDDLAAPAGFDGGLFGTLNYYSTVIHDPETFLQHALLPNSNQNSVYQNGSDENGGWLGWTDLPQVAYYDSIPHTYSEVVAYVDGAEGVFGSNAMTIPLRVIWVGIFCMVVKVVTRLMEVRIRI